MPSRAQADDAHSSMSGLKSRERLQPSLLDRLTDHAPAQKRDGPDQQVLNMAQLRQAVLRDLDRVAQYQQPGLIAGAFRFPAGRPLDAQFRHARFCRHDGFAVTPGGA